MGKQTQLGGCCCDYCHTHNCNCGPKFPHPPNANQFLTPQLFNSLCRLGYDGTGDAALALVHSNLRDERRGNSAIEVLQTRYGRALHEEAQGQPTPDEFLTRRQSTLVDSEPVLTPRCHVWDVDNIETTPFAWGNPRDIEALSEEDSDESESEYSDSPHAFQIQTESSSPVGF